MSEHEHPDGDDLILPSGYGPIDPASAEEADSAPEEADDVIKAAEEALGAEPERLTEEEKESLAAQGLPEDAVTVFSVVLGRDGRWIGTSRTDAVSLITYDREATFDDFIIGCGAVGSDAQQIRMLNAIGALLGQSAQQTAGMVVGALQQQANALQEQMNAQKILNDVRGKGGLRGPRG